MVIKHYQQIILLEDIIMKNMKLLLIMTGEAECGGLNT